MVNGIAMVKLGIVKAILMIHFLSVCQFLCQSFSVLFHNELDYR